MSLELAKPTFEERVAAFNETYELKKISAPEMAGRLINFLKIIKEEITEGDELLEKIQNGKLSDLDAVVEMADWLGDIQVYCASEMIRYDIPVDETLQIIMDSNESKLGEDGKPMHDERGKIIKGPNYWKPEPKIKELLINHGNQTQEGI